MTFVHRSGVAVGRKLAQDFDSSGLNPAAHVWEPLKLEELWALVQHAFSTASRSFSDLLNGGGTGQQTKAKNGFLGVEHVRPISVLSVWRRYAAAMVGTPSMRNWRKSFLHPAVSHGVVLRALRR